MENLVMKFRQKNILVTGGTGFVGSHLVEDLVCKGANVVTTFQSLDPKSYFSSKQLGSKVSMEQADLVDYEKMLDMVTKFEIEYIFHLGAQALVDVAFYNPRRTYESNVMGTVNVLEAARMYPGVKAVVVASSDKAYGKVGKKAYTEDMALKGDHPYEASKSATDLIAQSYFHTYGLPVAITRFGNIYGEGDLNFSRIIPGAIKSLTSNTILKIRSNGKFVRDYLYVKDVVSGYLLLAQNIATTKGQAYNFGSNDTLSVLDLLKIIDSKLEVKIRQKILNQAKNEIPYQSLDYKKITKELGWKPASSVSSTIEQIYSWYLNN
jgi:CDP-glucose 4,6-dehydratase